MHSTYQTNRADVQLGVIVDIAVELLVMRGRRAAATFLDASGANFTTVVRVLSESTRRCRPLPQNVLPLPRLKRCPCPTGPCHRPAAFCRAAHVPAPPDSRLTTDRAAA